MANSIKIKVNGLTHNVTASLDTALLYAAVTLVLVQRRDKPSLGSGEPVTCPLTGAIANAWLAS
jgi:hypothetical protein